MLERASAGRTRNVLGKLRAKQHRLRADPQNDSWAGPRPSGSISGVLAPVLRRKAAVAPLQSRGYAFDPRANSANVRGFPEARFAATERSAQSLRASNLEKVELVE
jgi:hypothetical protein